MKKITLAAAVAAVIAVGSVGAANRLGALPISKATGIVKPKAIAKETAFNSFIVKLPATRSQRSTDVAAFVASAASRVGLYGLRAKADGTKIPFAVTHSRKLATGAHLVKLSHGITLAEANALTTALKGAGAVYGTPNYKFRPHSIPNDPQYNLQWHFSNPQTGINAEQAWDVSTGEGTVTAVIDTGYVDHQDLSANIVPGYDFITEPFNSRDGDGRDPDAHDMGDWGVGLSSWHGTHIAGTIAAVTDNGIGVAGIAHGGKVMPVRVMGPYGGDLADIMDAMVWAAGGQVEGIEDTKTPATVINMSLGAYTPGGCLEPFQDAIEKVVGRGVSLVVSAGNDLWHTRDFTPASCAGVITVAASAVDGGRSWWYSNFGEHVAVAAPGGNGYYANEPTDHFIWSLGNLGEFEPMPSPEGDAVILMEGTSQSAPHVAGTIALMQSAAVAAGRRPWLPSEIKTILRRSVNQWVFNPSPTQYSGPGIVNAAAAVYAARQDMPSDEAMAMPLLNKYPVGRQYATARDSLVYKIEVPAGRASLVVRTYGGVGDVDLFVNRGSAPDEKTSTKSVRVGTTEQVTFLRPQEGTYYIRVHGKAAFGDVSVLAAY